MKLRIGMALVVACLAGTALAAEVGGVKLDDKASVAGQELVLNGAGIRTRAVFKVYVGSLYVPAKANTAAAVLAKGPRRVQMNMLRNLSPEQMIDALVDGLKDNATEAEFAAMKPQTDQLVSIMKGMGDLKEGNVVTLDFVDGGTRLSLNGQPKGTIAGEPFNQALTKIWIGDKPVQADLKKAMLGG
ncbi:MAG TPA: chalcone isomerase family protein [Casimicrobiaceae bacterium]